MAQAPNPSAPRNPAPVSGPSQFSKRTDLAGQPQRDLPNAGYGEQKDFQAIQGGARMAQAPQPQTPQIVPLSAPSQRPNEPVSAGYSTGPGAGPSALGLEKFSDIQKADFKRLAEYMPIMEHYVNSGASTGTMKAFMRFLRSQT